MLPAPRSYLGLLAERNALLDSPEPGGRVAAPDAGSWQLDVPGPTWREVAAELPAAADDEPSHPSRDVELLRHGRAILPRWEAAFLLDIGSFPVLSGEPTTQISDIPQKVKTARKAGGPA
jgi:hypothetical protein